MIVFICNVNNLWIYIVKIWLTVHFHILFTEVFIVYQTGYIKLLRQSCLAIFKRYEYSY